MTDRLVNFFTNGDLKKMNDRKEKTTFIVKHSKTEYQQFQRYIQWVQFKKKTSQSETIVQTEIQSKQTICDM